MKRWYRRFRCIIAVVLAALCLPLNAHADTSDGLAEFRQGRFAEALQEWQGAAAGGDARAALFIGVLYDSGLGTRQDSSAALTWYRRAADAGNAAAAFNVAVMFDAGRGVAKDPIQAFTWYQRAADKGFARAEYNLALLYESGIGTSQNTPQAIKFYRKAAAQGLTAARAHLARLGIAVAVIRPSSESAMAEFRQAQQILLYRDPANVARATEMFRRAAERNNPLAEYDLAYCYEHGLGVAPNQLEAYNWYRRAANHTDNAMLKSIALAGLRGIDSQLSAAGLGVPSAR